MARVRMIKYGAGGRRDVLDEQVIENDANADRLAALGYERVELPSTSATPADKDEAERRRLLKLTRDELVALAEAAQIEVDEGATKATIVEALIG